MPRQWPAIYAELTDAIAFLIRKYYWFVPLQYKSIDFI